MSDEIRVYAREGGNLWEAIVRATKEASGLQMQFAFTPIPVLARELKGSDAIDIAKLEEKLRSRRSRVQGVVICEPKFTHGIQVHELLPERIYLSGHVARGVNAPPFRLYLLYQFAAAALTLRANLEPQTNDEMIHRPPIGCLWDWWKGVDQRSNAMLIARICSACRGTLQRHGGLGPEKIAAAQQILEYVRRTMMGESPNVADRVFIAHSENPEWETLRDLLRGWNLQVEHYERLNAAGDLVSERWNDMLNRSRFAFAVMTPDDPVGPNGSKRARQNVVHEIGLCHARLGLRNTAILLAEGTETFSNIDGVSLIKFAPGRLASKKGSIRKLLVERGML
jgi:hypothetical protein